MLAGPEPVDRNDAHTLELRPVQKQADGNPRTRNPVKLSGEGLDGVRAAAPASSSQVWADISLHNLFAAPLACASLFNDVYLWASPESDNGSELFVNLGILERVFLECNMHDSYLMVVKTLRESCF